MELLITNLNKKKGGFICLPYLFFLYLGILIKTIKVMTVKVNFEFDLEGLVEANKDHILLKGRSNEEIIDELKDLFKGDLNRGFSNYCENMFVLEFGDIFNY